jgi:urocanate hydratase
MVTEGEMNIMGFDNEGGQVVISNGMVVGSGNGKDHYEKMYAMGNSMYGEMTAGCYCYIGP